MDIIVDIAFLERRERAPERQRSVQESPVKHMVKALRQVCPHFQLSVHGACIPYIFVVEENAPSTLSHKAVNSLFHYTF